MIHIRRQNEAWYTATFLFQDHQQIDLIRQFSQVRLETVQEKAKLLWDSQSSLIQRHTRGSETYNSRLLALFLMNSITPDFATLLHSRIDQQYSSDGPLLLFTMCNHIHRNHLAFIESIKNKIRLTTLTEFKQDVPSFLRFLQDNLRLITSTGASDTAHNDLIPHILSQLRSTTIPIFQQSVLQWQRNYMENKLALTPSSLVSLADEECQVLRHSNQWVETIDPSITAMQALLQTNTIGSKELLKTLTANFSEITKRQREINRDLRYNKDDRSRYNQNNNPDWIFDQPEDLTKPRYFNGRHWYFCTKCGRNGRWVCTHDNTTHRSPSPASRNDTYHQENRHHTRYNYGHSPRKDVQDDRRYSQGRHNEREYYSSRYHDEKDRTYHRASASGRSDRNHDRSRSRSPYHSRSPSPMHARSRSVSFRPPTPKSPSAHLSLLDSINAFIGDP